MSHTSDWPLPADSLRLPIPAALLEKLAVHPLSRDLYPTSLGHYRRARDHRMSRERHDEHLLIYCSEGQGLLRVREGEAWREYRVGSGDLLWLPPAWPTTTPPTTVNPGPSFGPTCAATAPPGCNTAPATATPAAPLGPATRPARRLRATAGGAPQRLPLPALPARRQPPAQPALPATAAAAARGQPGPRRAARLHARTPHARLELERLAAFCNLSKFHFVSRYKAITGRTPIQHFLHLKIEYACQLLDSSDQSVAGSARRSATTGQLLLSRLFSKVMGLSPSAYRQRVRQGEGGA